MTRKPGWISWVMTSAAAFLVVVLGLVAVGVHASAIPILGFVGTVTFLGYGSQETLMSLALTWFWAWRWAVHKRRSAATLGIVAVASAGLLGWSSIQVMRTMRAQGVSISLERSVFFAGDGEVGGAIETVSYGSPETPLKLLVYPRLPPAGRPHPVLVYIHGGAGSVARPLSAPPTCAGLPHRGCW